MPDDIEVVHYVYEEYGALYRFDELLFEGEEWGECSVFVTEHILKILGISYEVVELMDYYPTDDVTYGNEEKFDEAVRRIIEGECSTLEEAVAVLAKLNYL